MLALIPTARPALATAASLRPLCARLAAARAIPSHSRDRDRSTLPRQASSCAHARAFHSAPSSSAAPASVLRPSPCVLCSGASLLPSPRRSLRTRVPLRASLSDLFAWHRTPPKPQPLDPQLVAFFSSITQQPTHTPPTHPPTEEALHPPSSLHAHSSALGAEPHSHDAVRNFSTNSSPTSDKSSSTHAAAGSSSSGSSHSHGGGSGQGGSGPSTPDPQMHSATYAQQATAALLASLHLSSKNRNRTLLRVVVAGVLVVGGLIYAFRDPLKANLSVQTADVAKRSLTDQNVQQQVNVLSAEVVQALLNNPSVMNQAHAFLAKLMASPETRTSLVQLLQATANDPATLALLSKFSAALLQDLMAKPETLAQLTTLLRAAITAPGNELALQVLFKAFVAEPATQQLVAGLAKQAALDVLGDEGVREAAKEALRAVTGDQSVQKSTGEAMWNSVKFALKPSWFGHHGHVHHDHTQVTPETDMLPMPIVVPEDVAQQAATEPVPVPVLLSTAPDSNTTFSASEAVLVVEPTSPGASSVLPVMGATAISAEGLPVAPPAVELLPPLDSSAPEALAQADAVTDDELAKWQGGTETESTQADTPQTDRQGQEMATQPQAEPEAPAMPSDAEPSAKSQPD